MKIKHRLLLSYGILVILALSIVGMNLVTLNAMQNDSNFINYSGRLRANSYNMAKLSNVIVNEDDKKSKEALQERIKRFDFLIESITNGNSEIGLSKLNHQPTITMMKVVTSMWETGYKRDFQTILQNSDTETLKRINENINSYVAIIDEMVTDYSEYSLEKVNKARNLNGIFILISTIIAGFSFLLINRGIQKPIAALMESLKELSIVDSSISKKIESSKIDEIAEMAGYFNELIYDQLTKTYNRRSGLARLSKMFRYDEKREVTTSLCFIDINGLKQVNDVLGHKYGDELIISAVDIIKSVIREYDFIIRMGGDEFLIVFSGIESDTAETVWARIVSSYEKINTQDHRPYLISISHGIVTYNNKQKSELDNLIKQADEKMYIEKRIIKGDENLNVIRLTR